MTEPITLEQLQNASRDADTLAKVINGDEHTDVTSRLRATYPTLSKALKTLMQNGLLNATAFATHAELLSSQLDDGSYAVVTDDTTDTLKNGFYKKDGGQWQAIAWNPTNQALQAIDDLNIQPDQVVHDNDGNVYDFAAVNPDTGQMVSGIGARSVLMGDMLLQADDGGLAITDGVGRTALYIDGQGQLRYPILQMPTDVVSVKSLPPLTHLPRLDIMHIVGNGQSLGDGSTSNTGENARGMEISTSQPYKNIMLKSGVTSIPSLTAYDGTAFAPLVAGTTVGKSSANESPLVNSANALTKRLLASNGDYTADDWVFCASYGGQGGQSIETLSGNLFDNLKQQMSDVATLAKSQGKSCAMWFYQYHGNESQYNQLKNNQTTAPNGSPTADPYTYESKLINHYWQVVNHAMSVYSHQDFLPYLVLGHQVNHAQYNTQNHTIAVAQWRISRKYPFAMLVVPVYQFGVNNRDNQHLHHEQAWLLGEYIARAYHHTLRHGKWRPCEPVAVAWGDSHIDVKYHAHGKIVIDNTLTHENTDYPNAGFDIYVDNRLVDGVISSVDVASDDTVRITLSRPINEPNAVLAYGRGRVGDVVCGGNVRDSHGDIDKVTLPRSKKAHAMHNASVMFEFSKIGGF